LRKHKGRRPGGAVASTDENQVKEKEESVAPDGGVPQERGRSETRGEGRK